MCRHRVKRQAEAKDPDDPRKNLLTNKLCGWCSVNAKAAGAEENCDACEHAKAIGWVRKETGGGRGYRFEPPAGVNVTKIDTVPKFIAQTTKVYGDHFRAQQQQQQAAGGGGGGGGGGGSEETREDAEQSGGGGGQETGGGGGRGGEQTREGAREETRGGTDGEEPSAGGSANAGGGAATGGGTPFEVNYGGAVASAEELLKGGAEGYNKAVGEEVVNGMKQFALGMVEEDNELEAKILKERREFLERLEEKRKKQEDGMDVHITERVIAKMMDARERKIAVLEEARTQLEQYQKESEELSEEKARYFSEAYDRIIQDKEKEVKGIETELERMVESTEEEFKRLKAELKRGRLEVDTPERSKRKLEVFLEQTKLDFGS